MYENRSSYYLRKKEGNEANIVDNETEQEAILVIKNLSRKLKEVTDELGKKEEIIFNLKNNFSGSDTQKIQIEGFKRQITILEEKLKLYDNEYNEKNRYLHEQFRNLSESENKLRMQLITKDKQIHDYDNLIKDQEKSLNQFKKQFAEKDSINNELKQELIDISNRFKNLSMKANLRDEEFRNIHNELSNKLRFMEEDKIKTDEKISELIDIVKQQSKELNELSNQINLNEREKKHLIKINESLQDDIDQTMKTISELKSQLNVIPDLHRKINEYETTVNHLQREIDNERSLNSQLNKLNNEFQNSFQNLKVEFSGENSPDYLREVIEGKENEIYNLKLTVDQLKKNNLNSENRIKEVEEENKEIVLGINNELRTINQWIETYLGVYYQQHIEIPELPLTVSKAIKMKIKFEILKENLICSQKRMNEELGKSQSYINELKKENMENFEKEEKIMSEISNLKHMIVNKNEEINYLQKEIETYSKEIGLNKSMINQMKNEINERTEVFNSFCNKILQSISSEVNFLKGNQYVVNNLFDVIRYKSNYTENIRDQIENQLENLFELSHKLLIHCEENNLNEKTQTLNLKNTPSQDNSLIIQNLNNNIHEYSNQIENLKFELKKKENENENLISKINTLENNLKELSEINNNKDSSEIEDLKEKLKIWEKKYKNIQKELELKEIQISSQEQMINRRDKEIQDLKKDSKVKNVQDQIKTEFD